MDWCEVSKDGTPIPQNLTKEWEAVKAGDKISVRMRYFISAVDGKSYIQPETDLQSQKCQLSWELEEAEPNSVIPALMVVQSKIKNAVFAKLDLDQSPTFTILACNVIEKIEET